MLQRLNGDLYFNFTFASCARKNLNLHKYPRSSRSNKNLSFRLFPTRLLFSDFPQIEKRVRKWTITIREELLICLQSSHESLIDRYHEPQIKLRLYFRVKVCSRQFVFTAYTDNNSRKTYRHSVHMENGG